MKMYISSTFLRFNLRLLLLGLTSVYILSGCTAVRQRIQPYRDRPPSEASRILPSKPPQQPETPRNRQITPQIPRQNQNDSLPLTEQPLYNNEKNKELLRPVVATVRSRVSFYAQRVKSWQELEQNKSRYRSPEQSRKLISCQSKVAALHDAYTELQIQLFNDRNIAASHEKLLVTQQHLQHKDFSYLEGECPALFKQLSTAPQRFTPEPVIHPERLRTPETFSGQPSLSSGQTDFNISPQYHNQYKYKRDLHPLGTTPPVTPPEPAPNYEERYQHAQSLLKQGKEEEARRILSDLLANVRQTGNRPLQIKILKKISELEFALRNYLPARILYEELQQLSVPFDRQHLIALQSVDSQREEVDAYASLLLSSMTSDPEQDGFTIIQQARSFLHSFPTSPLRSRVDKLATKAEQEAEQWFHRFIQDVDRLVVNQKRQEALNLLEKVPLDILPLDKQEIIRERKNALTAPPVSVEPSVKSTPKPEEMSPDTITERTPQQAQQPQQQKKEKPVQEQPVPETTRPSSKQKALRPPQPQQTVETKVQEKWDRAEQALQTAEYDKAIALFSDLLNTSLDSQARKKIKKASQAAGQEARKTAANFFQRANSATDPQVKKKHLLSSKALLEDILQKYPLAGLDAKVKRNLSRVDKELTALDHIPFE
jgi:tetratricopeptide (TPR) repeat protein